MTTADGNQEQEKGAGKVTKGDQKLTGMGSPESGVPRFFVRTH